MPLEEAIIPESTRIVGGLQEKWKKRPMPTKEEPHVDTENLSKKWKTIKRQTTQKENIDVSSITIKWKR